VVTPVSSIVVLIAANSEWEVVTERYGVGVHCEKPFEWFSCEIKVGHGKVSVVFVRTGCGKTAAASATQFAIDRWRPEWVVNLGTCGGSESAGLTEGDIIAASRTAIYDIIERSGGQQKMEDRYTTKLDISTFGPPYPASARAGVIVSADQDVDPMRIPFLRSHFGAIAGDWESAAVAHVARTVDDVNCLVLRVVSDVVGPSGGPIYQESGGDNKVFAELVRKVMPPLLDSLPEWLARMACQPDGRT